MVGDNPECIRQVSVRDMGRLRGMGSVGAWGGGSMGAWGEKSILP